MDEGRCGSEWYVFSNRSRPLPPSSVRATPCQLPRRGSFLTFPSGEGGSPQARRKRGVTGESGTYFPTAPAQNAPPQSGLRPASSPVGEAFNLPLRGRGTAAAVDEGRCGSEWYVFSNRSRPERPSSVRATPCQLPRRGSFFSPQGKVKDYRSSKYRSSRSRYRTASSPRGLSVRSRMARL